VDTSVAHEMRGMHQQRWGVGMLGHALGESFDFKAIDNPNIKIDDNHSYAYLVGKFGGVGGKRGTGRATTAISESSVEKTGAETTAGKSTTEGAALIDTVRQQFEEMAQTSERLKASMASQMPALQAARDLYFEQPRLRAELAKAKSDLAHADAIAKKQVVSMKIVDPAEKQQAIDQIKADLADAVQHKQEAVDRAEDVINKNLTSAFAAWTASIQSDIDTDQGKLDQSKASGDAMTTAEHELDAIDLSSDDAMTKLGQFAADHKLTTLDQMKRPPKDAKTYKKQLVIELKKHDDVSRSGLKKNDADVHADITALEFYKQKLSDRSFIFGHGEKHADGHWGTRYGAESVPLMQLLENGTVRNDAMPQRETSGARKGVYNGEVVATLAKFGWAPGANFGDTMHFDFIEGYNKAVPGGRGAANMKRTRYSPEGDLPPPQPAHKDETKK
jgi:hypothetical protein